MKKYIFLFFVNVLLSPSGYGQLIRPLDKGLQQFNQNIQTIYSYGNDAYVVTNMGSTSIGSNFEYTIKIAKWNGISWSYLPTLRAISSLDIPAANYFIKNLCMFNNELYITGMFDSISGIIGSTGIVKWTGNFYQSVGGGFMFSDVMKLSPINASKAFWGMLIWQGELIVAAEIKQAGTKTVNNLARWNGSSWNFVGKTALSQGFLNTTTGLTFSDYFKGIAADDVLILHGTFTSVGGNSSVTGLAFCNGIDSLVWDKIKPHTSSDQLFYDNISQLISYPKNKYGGVLFYSSVLNRYGVFNSANGWRTTSEWAISPALQPKTYGYGTTSLPLVFWYQGSFWALGTDNYFYKDFTTRKSFCKTPSFVPSNSLFNTGSYDYQPANILLCGMPTYGTDIINYAGGFLADGGIMTGKVYVDQNNNCQYDTGEPLIKNEMIDHGNGYVSTDENGVYTANLKAGVYNLGLAQSRKNWSRTCPGGTGKYNALCFMDSVIKGYDFSIRRDSNITDVQVSLVGHSGWRARRGFAENYVLHIDNLGSNATGTFSVYMKLPAKGNLESIGTNPDNVTGKTLRFDISNIAVGGKRQIMFSYRIPGPDSIDIGEALIFMASSSPAFNLIDKDTLDNMDTLNQKVVAAHDPNDKQSNPHIYVLPGVKKIDYQIRFQNIGSDTAYGVTVLDTVDTRLPLKEITINSASHPYRFAVINNVLFWRFDGIMLPPVKTDEPRSHGWIRYSSKLAQGLPIGTEILNKAYIYFDYEKPVITNEALIRLVQDTLAMGIPAKPKALNETIRLYPNPAGSFFVLENTGVETEQIEIYSLIGEKIQVLNLKKETQLIINTTDWKSGVYFIRSGSGKATTLVIQH
ncbi:MAG: T9SS type A sorting domain-containing protein [Bacteroidia bacterium]|nr:T9SS type A sorting domain-containing protein [Bacteroidia bacterium]